MGIAFDDSTLEGSVLGKSNVILKEGTQFTGQIGLSGSDLNDLAETLGTKLINQEQLQTEQLRIASSGRTEGSNVLSARKEVTGFLEKNKDNIVLGGVLVSTLFIIFNKKAG